MTHRPVPGLKPTSIPSGILMHPAVWPQWTWAENWGGGSAPFLGKGAGSPYNTKSPGPRPTCVPSFILIRPTVWPQYTNVTDRTHRTDRPRSDSIGRTVLQTVAQKSKTITSIADCYSTMPQNLAGIVRIASEIDERVYRCLQVGMKIFPGLTVYCSAVIALFDQPAAAAVPWRCF